jgi:hypothetical protein
MSGSPRGALPLNPPAGAPALHPEQGPSAPGPRAGPPALHPAPFSLLRQRKGGKRKAGLLRSPARPAAKRVPCGARQGGHAQNSLRSLRSLRSDKLRESDHDVRLRRTAPLSALLGGADGGQQPAANSQQPNFEPLTAGSERIAGCSVFGCSASHPLCAAEQRRRPARVPQARIPSDSRSLFEPEVAQRLEASSARGRASSSAGNPSPTARGERSVGPPFFSPLFFGGAKKRGSGSRGEAPWAGVWGPQAPKGCHTGTPNSCSC